MNDTSKAFRLRIIIPSLLALAGAIYLGWRAAGPRRAERHLRPSMRASAAAVTTSSPVGPVDRAAWEGARAVLAETLKNAPQRLSTTARIPPFDKASFAHDPKEYLSRIEPARCFQTADPGPDVPALAAASDLRTAVREGQDASLWVKTVANAPVTFTAFGGGTFRENGLPTVTVQGDARGLASARFSGTADATGDVTIVVGSPLASGNQRFFVRVGS